MSPLSATEEHTAARAPQDAAEQAPEPGSWLEALSMYLNSRIDLMRLEGRSAGRLWGRSAVLFAVAALAGLVAWLALTAGLIALLAVSFSWPWHWVALGAGLAHLLAAAVCVKAALTTNTAAFPLTRQEFAKDRQWLLSLTTRRK